MIKIGDAIPAINITVIDSSGQNTVSAAELFANKKTVLFALPGAFTPTCSEAHLPGFIVAYDDLKAKGVDTVVCLSVNDSFVMSAWQEAQNAQQLTMLADGNAEFTKALGLTLETGPFGGTRSQRYSMLIDNGKVAELNIEPGKELSVSDAKTILSQL